MGLYHSVGLGFGIEIPNTTDIDAIDNVLRDQPNIPDRVGHIIVGGLLLAEKYGDWPMWWHMALWPALTVILSIALMQPVKGGVVGLQWALRMHGFGGEADQPERQPLPPRGRQP